MAEFTLDTSGRVVALPNAPHAAPAYCWTDLDAFTQGYIEALFSGPRDWPGKDFAAFRARGMRPLGFRDLAPETLALILKDCEAVLMLMAHAAMKDSSAAGREFWARRQAGRYDRAIAPPLAAYLGDDGKVYLREGQS